MIDAKAYLSEKFLETIADNRILDGFVQFAVDRALKDEEGVHHGLMGILYEREEPIVMTPEISAVQDQFCTEIMGKFSLGLGQAEGVEQCLQGLRAVSIVLFNVFINQVIIAYVQQLDYIRIRERDGRDPQYIVEIKINGKTVRRETSFGKKRTQIEAIAMTLKAREQLFAEKQEVDERKARKKPNLTICRKLVRKGILEEFEDRKFKIKGMVIRPSEFIGSSYWLFLRVGEIEHGRSLDKHSFDDAFNQLIASFNKELDLNTNELQELQKFKIKFLYSQKTSRK